MSSADGSACCAGSAAAAGAVACSGAVTPGSADPASDCTAPGGAGFASTCAATGGVDFGIGAGPGGMSCGLASTAAAVGGGVAAGLADAGSCGLASTAAAVGGGGAAGLADAGAWAVAASDPVGSTGGGATLFGPAETGAGEGTYDGVGLDSIENSSVLFLRIADQKALAASAVTGAKVTLSSASATGGAFALAFGIGLVWKGWLLQACTGDGWIASGGGDASIGVGTALGDGSMITIGDTGWFGHGVSSCWLFSTGSVTTGWLSSTNIGSTLSTTGAIDMAAGLGSGWLVSTAGAIGIAAGLGSGWLVSTTITDWLVSTTGAIGMAAGLGSSWVASTTGAIGMAAGLGLVPGCWQTSLGDSMGMVACWLSSTNGGSIGMATGWLSSTISVDEYSIVCWLLKSASSSVCWSSSSS